MPNYNYFVSSHSSVFLTSAWLYYSWRRQWQPTPVLLPGKSHGWRSLVGCTPWSHEESDTTECLHFHFSLSCIGEGNSKTLQCFCLENPRDGGAWWTAVYGVAQSRTWLKWLSMHACIGEGNGNTFPYSCRENPGDRGAWWCAVYGVGQSRTQLKQLCSSSSSKLVGGGEGLLSSRGARYTISKKWYSVEDASHHK